jgi:hypothetical protein
VLTPAGASLLLAIAAGASDDSLAGGSVAVSDGTRRSERPLDAAPEVQGPTEEQGAVATLTATFGEQEANFEWAITDVLSAGGIVVDREVADKGRKAAGAVWTLQTRLELVP